MSNTQELTVVTDIPQQLAQAEVLKDLAVDSSAALVKSFAPHFSSFYKLLPEAKAIAPDAPKAARIMRLKIREVRLDSDRTRVAIKAESLRRSKAIDGIHSLLLNDLTPIEEALDSIEKAEERREAARKEGIRAARTAQLIQYQDPSFVTHYDLANMSVPHFDQLLAQTKLAKETADAAAAKVEADRIAAAKLAEEQRIAKEIADKAERDRLAAENARLAEEAKKAKAAKEAADRENARKLKEAADKTVAEQAKRDAQAAKEKADRDAVDKAKEDARLAAEKVAAAQRAKEQKARDDAQAAKDRAAQKLIDDAKAEAKHLAEVEATRRALEAKRVADDQAAVKRAAAAPDKVKLAAFAKAVRALPIPTLTTATDLQTKLASQTNKFAAWVDAEAAKL